MTSRIGLAALALTLAACQDIPDGPSPSPQVVGTQYVLAVGDQVSPDSELRVTFADVKGDSRCPATADCIWAGDGEIEISVAIGRSVAVPFRLHTTLDPRQVDVGGYRIRLVDLMPYPQVPGPIPLDAYAARLEIARLSQ